MKEKVLSIFIDESGDFGQYNPASPNYYVAMVLHDQEIDISKKIEALERQISNWGYPEHTIHTGPLIRREVSIKMIYENKGKLYLMHCIILLVCWIFNISVQ